MSGKKPKKMTPKKKRELRGRKPKRDPTLNPPRDPAVLRQLDALESRYESLDRKAQAEAPVPVPEEIGGSEPEEEEKEPSECEQMHMDKGWTLEEAREMCESMDQDNIVVQLREKETVALHPLAKQFPGYPVERLDEILFKARMRKKGDLLTDILFLLAEALGFEIPEPAKKFVQEAYEKAKEEAVKQEKETYLLVEGGRK